MMACWEEEAKEAGKHNETSYKLVYKVKLFLQKEEQLSENHPDTLNMYYIQV